MSIPLRRKGLRRKGGSDASGGAFPGFGGAPAPIDIGDAGSGGAAATASRSDHQHELLAPAGAPPPIAAAGAVGISTRPARSDHTHEGVHTVNGMLGDVVVGAFPGFGPAPVQIDAGDGAVVGVSGLAAQSDHQHAVNTAGLAEIADSDAGAESAGVSATIPRGDHKHHVTTASPTGDVNIGDVAVEGVSAALTRADHQHAFVAPAVGYPVDVDAGAEADGIDTAAARADHKHTVSTAAPTGAIDIGDANAAGVAATLARSDHQHAFTAPGAGYPLDVAGTEADGAATTPARSDHVHRGLRSIEANAAGDLFGDVRLVDSATVLFTQAGNDLSAAVVAAAVNRNTISVSQPDERLQLGAGEVVIVEANVNPAVFQVGTSVTPFLSAIAQRTSGTATIRIRVGGTINTADGTVRSTITVTAATPTQFKNVGASFDMNASDIGAGALVKVTLEAAAGETIRAYGIEATFSG